MRRTIVIGDVHGCYDEMVALIKECRYNQTHDQLIFVGDLVNKGPQSSAVLDFVKKNNHKVVLGNHEQKLLDTYDGLEEASPSIQKTLDDMSGYFGDELPSIIDWIRSWPLYIETDQFLVTHAGLPPGRHPSQTKREILTNIRTWDGIGQNLNNENDPAWHTLYLENKLVIYGHWALQGLHITENTIGLDSGCVYGGQLSAAVLPEKRIVQVTAEKAYQEI